jgi:hypothetical protein
MATLHAVYVLYHWERNGKVMCQPENISLAVADLNFSTFVTAITVTLGKSFGGATCVIDSYKMLGFNLTN